MIFLAKRNIFWIFGFWIFVGGFLLTQKAFGQESTFFERIVPLHQVKKDPGPMDWLATQKEAGQNFSDFVASQVIAPSRDKSFIYIVLLGDFTQEQKKVVQMTSQYIAVYFQMSVKFGEPISLTAIPDSARRVHSQTADAQILSTYVIDDVLKPRIPQDAFCLIAFTPSDLWPGPGWNFVFGQASIEDRVGVWSLYRNGDISKDFNLFLRRTIQTGTHEIAHLFGLHHCIYYECNINGSNSRRESDSRPLWECPVCLRKLAWINKMDIKKRYRQLADISKEFGFDREAEFFDHSLGILNKE